MTLTFGSEVKWEYVFSRQCTRPYWRPVWPVRECRNMWMIARVDLTEERVMGLVLTAPVAG